jgi:hypothetical protein
MIKPASSQVIMPLNIFSSSRRPLAAKAESHCQLGGSARLSIN